MKTLTDAPPRRGLTLRLLTALALSAMPPLAISHAAEASFPTLADAIAATCLEQANDTPSGPEGCRVLDTQTIGRANDTTLHFARYCLDEPGQTEGGACYFQGMAVFSEASPPEPVERLYSTNDDISEPYLTPSLVQSPYGTILYVQITVDGTGHYNESDYLLLKDGQWQLIDSRGWVDDLLKRLPAGAEIHKGIWPDFGSMTAQAFLYQAGDPNCCPSVGTADIELELVGTRLGIKEMTIKPVPE